MTDPRCVGICEICGVELYHDDENPTSEQSNVGDYDFICYPCQFEAIDNDTWDNLIYKHRKDLT